jgi:hypothetical protein
MATKNKKEEIELETPTFTDWILDIPMKIFFWGGVIITFALWILAVGLVFIFTRR